jgi:hypothetical protein
MRELLGEKTSEDDAKPVKKKKEKILKAEVPRIVFTLFYGTFFYVFGARFV